MGTTTFSGPIRAGTIRNTNGTTVGTDVANVGYVVMCQSYTADLSGGALAAVVTDMVIPANSKIVNIIVDLAVAANVLLLTLVLVILLAALPHTLTLLLQEQP